ncbi:(d)CMP kinase [Marinilabiliaceae bacterium ANBcel2]|nr:(d)CMP kinase [Marinilabiliaceae bacterium ANBcel2]
MQDIIIAVDGHSSCGKSTVAKEIANELNLIYIDTGAMYRALTLYALNNNIATKKDVNLIELEKKIPHIDIKFSKENNRDITLLNGKNVEDKIRSIEVSNNVSAISAIPFVRKHLVKLQQEMGKKGGVILDGRDIGTVVFPNADIKIFMTASPEVRAERRFKEMKEKGDKISFNEVLENIKMRDYTDSNRSESPLKKADDALILDNSNMNREEQLVWVKEQLKNKGWL